MFTAKPSSSESTVWRLVELTPTGAVFKSCVVDTADEEEKAVAFPRLKTTMVPYKGKLQVHLNAEEITKRIPCNNGVYHREAARAALYIELVKLAAQSKDADLHYLLFPHDVRSAKSFKKGDLVLCPITELHRINQKSATAQYRADGPNGNSFFLEAPSRVSKDSAGDWKPNEGFVGLWWIRKSSEEAECNMKLFRKKFREYTFPVLANTRAIIEMEKLRVFEPVGPAAAKKART